MTLSSDSLTLRSYPKVYNLGHRALRDLFEGPVVIQEKVDGSQFSFGIIDGELQFRSRRQRIDIDDVPQMFRPSVATVQAAAEQGALKEGVIYRGEAMRGPRHNTLVYERAPRGNIVLFDLDVGLEDRPGPWAVANAAVLIGCESAPLLYWGEVDSLDLLKALLNRESFLGGQLEGIVVKNYARFGEDGKMLMGKLVTDDFREKHARNPDWKRANKGDILDEIQGIYNHPRRWEKAIERARDAGELTGSPKDIGPLIQSIQQDVLEECRDEIAERLFKHYERQIRKGLTRGFPEWYKGRLLEEQEF